MKRMSISAELRLTFETLLRFRRGPRRADFAVSRALAHRIGRALRLPRADLLFTRTRGTRISSLSHLQVPHDGDRCSEARPANHRRRRSADHPGRPILAQVEAR